MNRKTVLALALASAFGLSSFGAFAESDGNTNSSYTDKAYPQLIAEGDEKEGSKPELIADDEKKDEQKPQLVAEGEDKGDSKPELIA